MQVSNACATRKEIQEESVDETASAPRAFSKASALAQANEPK
jgi:hypothetical protein